MATSQIREQLVVWEKTNFAFDVYLILGSDDQPHQAKIYYNTPHCIWMWQYTPQMAATIECLKMLVMLLPEKIAETLELRKLNGTQDGSIMVETMAQSIRTYLEIIKSPASPANTQNPQRILSFQKDWPFQTTKGTTLENVLVEYLDLLVKYKKNLTDRCSLDVTHATGIKLLVFSDDILRCCKVLLNFVKPCWNSYRQSTDHTETKSFSHHRNKLYQDLSTGGGCTLYNEFVLLGRIFKI